MNTGITELLIHLDNVRLKTIVDPLWLNGQRGRGILHCFGGRLEAFLSSLVISIEISSCRAEKIITNVYQNVASSLYNPRCNLRCEFLGIPISKSVVLHHVSLDAIKAIE
jgi:hypothetical protein